jgi:hypothetical protein
MYTTSAFHSQIYASLLPDRHSSPYGSHFLIRQVYNPIRPTADLLGLLALAWCLLDADASKPAQGSN